MSNVYNVGNVVELGTKIGIISKKVDALNFTNIKCFYHIIFKDGMVAIVDDITMKVYHIIGHYTKWEEFLRDDFIQIGNIYKIDNHYFIVTNIDYDHNQKVYSILYNNGTTKTVYNEKFIRDLPIVDKYTDWKKGLNECKFMQEN